MDPAFIGTWQVDRSKTEGLDEFGKVMGFSAEKIELYKQLDYAFTISQDGDTYKVDIDFKGAVPNATYTLKIGEPVDYKSIDGYTAKLTVGVADGKIVESYVYAEKNLQWTVTRSLEGDVMTCTTRLGEATMTQVLTRA